MAAGPSDVSGTARQPRVLVTGFSAFPGAPVNPTEGLMADLAALAPHSDAAALRTVVLPVEYDTVRDRLCEAARGFDPDIAIHFGLAAGASGFRLEHVARNEHRARPDNAGRLPATGPICAAPETMPSTLPLDAIAAALSAEGLPVEWSDDAGGYLCNMVFMLSQAHACDGLFPTMGGFVHVPHLARREDARGLSRAELARGALIIIDATVRAWRAERTSSPLS